MHVPFVRNQIQLVAEIVFFANVAARRVQSVFQTVFVVLSGHVCGRRARGIRRSSVVQVEVAQYLRI